MTNRKISEGVRGVLTVLTIIVLTFMSSQYLSYAALFTSFPLPPLMACMARRHALLYGTATNFTYWLWVLGGNIWQRTAYTRVTGEHDDGWYFFIHHDLVFLIVFGIILTGIGFVCSLPVYFAQKRAAEEN